MDSSEIDKVGTIYVPINAVPTQGSLFIYLDAREKTLGTRWRFSSERTSSAIRPIRSTIQIWEVTR